MVSDVYSVTKVWSRIGSEVCAVVSEAICRFESVIDKSDWMYFQMEIYFASHILDLRGELNDPISLGWPQLYSKSTHFNLRLT